MVLGWLVVQALAVAVRDRIVSQAAAVAIPAAEAAGQVVRQAAAVPI